MKTIRMSATEARNNFFQLLNQVMYEGVRVVIEKAGTQRQVVIEQKATDEEEKKELLKALEETRGMWKDVPESQIYDDRLRGKRGKEFLDKLRKGDV